MKILLADFNVKVGIENDLKPRSRNTCINQDNNDNYVKKLILPRQNIWL
jgi:hypothetical protein